MWVAVCSACQKEHWKVKGHKQRCCAPAPGLQPGSLVLFTTGLNQYIACVVMAKVACVATADDENQDDDWALWHLIPIKGFCAETSKVQDVQTAPAACMELLPQHCIMPALARLCVWYTGRVMLAQAYSSLVGDVPWHQQTNALLQTLQSIAGNSRLLLQKLPVSSAAAQPYDFEQMCAEEEGRFWQMVRNWLHVKQIVS